MYKFVLRRMIRRNSAALARGDIGPLLAGYHREAVLVFPGTSSWGGEHRGKPAIEAFLRRFVAARLVGEIHDIVVSGPPWNTRVAVFFIDQAAGSDGVVVYENRAVLYGRIVWGKIVYQEDFEDTVKAEAFDLVLADWGV